MPPKKPPARPRRLQASTDQVERKDETQTTQDVNSNQPVTEQQTSNNAAAENGSATSISVAQASNNEATESISSPNVSSSSRGRGNALRASSRPRGIGRRSVQGRAELERVEAERKQAEAANQLRSASRGRRDGGRTRGVGVRRRGGYAGEKERAPSIVSGPFSLGEVRKAEGRRAYAGTGKVLGGGSSSSQKDGRGDGIPSSSATHQSGSSSKSRSGGTQIKQEGGSNNDVAMTDVYLKQEDGGLISSDGEDEADGIRKLNIDDPIDLTVDDGDKDSTYLLPVRIQRVEHRERALLANAESTKPSDSVASATAKRQVESRSPDRRRAKQRVKDVEITGSNHKYKGTYSDSSDDEVVEVKAEPVDTTTSLAEVAPQTRTVSPELRRAGKEKARSYSNHEVKKPHFHSAEEEVEWDGRQRDLRILRAELGDATATENGDSSAAQGATNPRDDKVYLFQMPAVLPALNTIVPKIENEDVEMQDVPKHRPSHDQRATQTNTRDASGILREQSQLPSGLVGKLKIHASGRAYLDWGGIPLEVSMGQEASFLQDVLLMDKVESKSHASEQKSDKDLSSAMSMGQVKGKFVVVPDWDSIFEQAA